MEGWARGSGFAADAAMRVQSRDWPTLSD